MPWQLPQPISEKLQEISARFSHIPSIYGDLRNIRQHEVQSESPCFHTKDLGLSREVINHLAHDHVRKSIGQQRRYLYSIS